MGGFEPRWYRRAMRPTGLVGFRVLHAQTDLMIHAVRDLSEDAARIVACLRRELQAYVALRPRFAESFTPVGTDSAAPAIAIAMAEAAFAAGVGPMAAVAGAFSDAVGEELLSLSPEVIVENGGDIFVAGRVDRVVAVWSGDEVAGFGVRLRATALPCGIATSSATVGPSVSLGRASAATVVARSAALADAVASGVGNRVHGPADVPRALDWGMGIAGVRAVVVVVDGAVGAVGDVELVPLGDALN